MGSRVVIPERILEVARQAAIKAHDAGQIRTNVADREKAYKNTVRVILEAAFLELSERPIVPTDEQLHKMFNELGASYSPASSKTCATEWQRRMVLAPEPQMPNIPDELKALLLDESIPEADFSRPTRGFYNIQLMTAYRIGRGKAGA